MARYRMSVCRLCRREALKLFLKGDRCYTEKCAIDRREYGPGQHGQERRTKLSEFGVQLREKQKVRRIYGVLERQFHKIFVKAERSKGETGKNLIRLLESRLDNMIYRMGFANSRNEARMLITQRHFLVNDRRVNIPSMFLKPGDVVSVREKSQKVLRIIGSLEASQRRGVPEWIDLDRAQMKAVLRNPPLREQITLPMQDELIVEYYSK